MPPALPPRDPAHTPAAPHPESPTSALLVEVDLLRRSVSTLNHELAGLRRAMESRALIDQAKGAVRALTGAGDDESFALLSARSQHQNRKLVSVAADVLAAVDASPERHRAVAAVLHLVDPGVAHARTHQTADASRTWQPRRRFDRTASSVTDARQLLAIADLAEQLSAAPTRDRVVEVLVGPGAAALGAFGASVASRDGTGHAVDEHPDEPADEHGDLTQVDGLQLAGGVARPLPLDAEHPVAETLRTGAPVVLARAELALRYPTHPRPHRLQGLVVLPVQADTVRAGAWSLYYDHHVPPDRSTRAMLEWAARLASTALNRAP